MAQVPPASAKAVKPVAWYPTVPVQTMITRYFLLYKLHKTLVLALLEFFGKVDKTNKTLQLFFIKKQYIGSRIYEHVSLRFK